MAFDPRYTDRNDRSNGRNGYPRGPSNSRHDPLSPQMFFGQVHDGSYTNPNVGDRFSSDSSNDYRGGRYSKSARENIKYMRYRRMMCFAVFMVILLIVLLLVIAAVLMALFLPRGSTSSTDSCNGVTCMNGGTCNDGVCACSPGYSGSSCETDNSVAVDAVIRLPNELFTSSLLDPNSADFNSLANPINANVASDLSLNDDPNFLSARVTGFGDGSVLVFLRVRFAGSLGLANAITRLQEILGRINSNSRINGMIVDPDYFGVAKQDQSCTQQTCTNRGTCHELSNGNTVCSCTYPYHGETCQLQINECSPTSCQFGGTCVQGTGSFTCQCATGYTGTNCEIRIGNCQGVTCLNGGTCLDLSEGYRCNCQTGYMGVHCETGTDECASNPCANEGTCTDGVNSFTCTCAQGWTGSTCTQSLTGCAADPCLNGATCSISNNAVVCTCAAGWMGDTCSVDVNECASSPCRLGGTCVNGANEFTCMCPVGRTGSVCLDDIQDCASNPCSNGVCTDGSNSYICSCFPGYSGTHCDEDIDDCAGTPCLNDGSCVDEVNRFSCNCAPGYAGTTCDIDIDECTANTDGCDDTNGGCMNSPAGSFTCTCNSGYELNADGVTCDDIDECTANTDGCDDTNGGCMNSPAGSFTCTCNSGYVLNADGVTCDDIDECNSTPCMNEGTCMNLVDRFTCQCAPGFSGLDCSEDINDCAESPCINGNCTDQVNGYTCECTPGYTDMNCSADINDCEVNLCENGGNCSDLVNDYSCECVTGFNGTNCETNIDECSSNPCANGATCMDEVNGYTCQCVPGTNGTHCEIDIDECSSNPCYNNGTCQTGQQLGVFNCSCLDNFFGDLCDETSETIQGEIVLNMTFTSDLNDNSTEEFMALASNVSTGLDNVLAGMSGNESVTFNGTEMISFSNGSVIVRFFLRALLRTLSQDFPIGRLRPFARNIFDRLIFQDVQSNDSRLRGYLGSITSVSVENADRCVSRNPCMNGGMCMESIDGSSLNCTGCNAGYTGQYCEIDINDCAESPCINGNCTDQVNGYTCECTPGYTDMNCSADINDCEGNLCENGGNCTDLVNDYSCECVTGFNGTNCETNIDDCSPNPCQNNGNCSDEINGYTCECVPGSNGTNCENDIDECASSPCLNNGTCTNGQELGVFNCSCAPNVSGELCGNIDECSTDQPCVNGGNCTDELDGYTCMCAAGWNGTNCDININDCSPNPCQNNGNCSDEINGYTCECVPGSNGTNCENDIDECASSPCLNNGTCTNGQELGVFNCSCVPNVSGELCENIDECSTEQPCVNGGTCMDKLDGYICMCAAGWNGTDCESDIDECASDPCFNNATCINGDEPTVFNCTCMESFFGELCDQTREMVQGDIVLNQTFTSDLNDNSSQAFQDLAANISNGLDDLFARNASNESSIIYDGNEILGFSNGSIRCFFIIRHILRFFARTSPRSLRQLARDRTDQRIIQDINSNSSSLEQVLGNVISVTIEQADLCTSRNPCFNDGVCELDPEDNVTRTCDCLPGFEGDYCKTDIDECANQNCSFGGECIDLIDDFKCLCTEDRTGELCELNLICTEIQMVLEPDTAFEDVAEMGNISIVFPNMEHNPDFESFLDYYQGAGNSTLVARVLLDALFTSVEWESDDIRNGDRGMSVVYGTACLDIPMNATHTPQDILESFAYLYQLYQPFFNTLGVHTFYVSGDDRCNPYPCTYNTTQECIAFYNYSGHECICERGFEGDMCEEEINECDIYPCENGATCEDLIGEYSCTCIDGWIGRNCSIDENDCASSPCMNGGVCVDNLNEYSCECLDGYYGSECQNVTNACDTASCENGATCVDFVFHHTCECTASYKGPNCTADANSRSCDDGGLCANDALCLDHPFDGFYCQCPSGWTGTFCDMNINDCEDVTCSERGQCFDALLEYNCQCEPGFEGQDCETDVDDCLGVDCMNGYCTDGVDSYSCVCNPGWTSAFCDTEINECASNPCDNRGSCIDGINGYYCNCTDGWTGERCEMMYDACVEENPCGIRETCTSQFRGYKCTCADGFTGDNCEFVISEIQVRFVLLNESSGSFDAGPFFASLNNQVSMSGSAYVTMNKTCGITQIGDLPDEVSVPKPVFNVDLSFCYRATTDNYQPGDDIYSAVTAIANIDGYPVFNVSGSESDLCDLQLCQNDQNCTSYADTYECNCESPYSGTHCEDVDSCLDPDCSFNGFCQATGRRNEFECVCYEGYRGDICEERFECVHLELVLGNGTSFSDFQMIDVDNITSTISPNTPPPANSSQFLDFYQEYEDEDPHIRILLFLLNDVTWNEDGSVGDSITVVEGQSCLSIDPDQGIMYPVINESLGYLLHLYRDYLEEFDIERVLVAGDDRCKPNPCQFGGSCYHSDDPFSGYYCHCPRGVTGDDCEMDVDECEEDEPCENEGTCTNVFGTFNCSCTEGWTGFLCNVESNPCKSQPCTNGATCVNDGDSFSCDCNPGYSGDNCSIEANACADDPCQEGTCNNFITYSTCDCPNSAKGAICDHSLESDCSETFCANNGTCGASEECICTPGWTGIYCQESIDDCLNASACDLDVCNDRGECIDLHLGYSCQCEPGFIGRDCQINVNDCDGVYCRNNGHCVDGENSFYCQCTGGWAGEFCEEDLDECDSMPCQNGGECYEEGIGSFNCSCPPGWRGDTCNEEIDPCEDTNPCRNGGACVYTGPGNYSCICSDNFEGDSCEIGTYMIPVYFHFGAAFSDSINDTTLEDALSDAFEYIGLHDKFCGLASYTNEGPSNGTVRINLEICYVARDEEFRPTTDVHRAIGTAQSTNSSSLNDIGLYMYNVTVDACEYKGCSNGSTCVPFFGDYAYCSCPPGIYGERCEYNPCEIYGCQNGGTCTLVNFEEESIPFQCTCPPEFSGQYCEFITMVVQIDVSLAGECGSDYIGFVNWFASEVYGSIVGYGYGQISNTSIVSYNQSNNTETTVTLDIETLIYPFWLELYESWQRSFEVDLEAAILSNLSLLEPPEGVECSAEFTSSRGVEICDRYLLPYSGYTTADRCSGTLECPLPFINDELECEPHDNITLSENECYALYSPGHPESYAPNQVFTTAFEAPEDYYIEIYVRHDFISLRPGDTILIGDGSELDIDRINPYVIQNDTLNEIPVRINTLSRKVFISFLSFPSLEVNLTGEFKWMLQVTVKPVVKTYYEVQPFRYQSLNFPEFPGPYEDGVTYVSILTTPPGFNLLLCSDFTHTFIDIGDIAVVGVSDVVSIRNVVGVFEASGNNPPPIPDAMFTLLDTDGSSASPMTTARYSGQVHSIPASADPSDVCPPRFMAECELNPCKEALSGGLGNYTCTPASEPIPCASLQSDPEVSIYLETGDRSTIQSPNYPNTYPANTFMLITINFESTMQVTYNTTLVRLNEGDSILIGQGSSFSNQIFVALTASSWTLPSESTIVRTEISPGPAFFLFTTNAYGIEQSDMPYRFQLKLEA